MTSPFLPNSFTYGDSPAGGLVMPMVVAGRNPSNAIDIQYDPGYLWLSDVTQGGSGNLYYNGGFTTGVPAWTLASAAGGALNSLSDGSTTITPSGGNIAIVGTAAEIVVTSSVPSHELILSIPPNFIAPGAITATTNMTVLGNLAVTGTSTFTGGITFSGNVAIGGTLDVTGLTTLKALTQAGTLSLNATGNAATTIGNAAGSGNITIQTPASAAGGFVLNGNGNATGILIGTDANNNTIAIGSNSGTTGVTITVGTNNFILTGAALSSYTIGSAAGTGTITLGQSTAGENISIGDGINVAPQIISIANGNSAANTTVDIMSGVGTAGAGTLSMANNRRVTTIDLGNVAPVASRTTTIGGGTVITAAVTDTINVGSGGATTNANSVKTVNINTGSVTTGQVLTNIASGTVTSGTHTTSIASGNRAAGTMALNLMTGTGTKTATLGNADGSTTFNVLGVANINVNQNSNTAINTGTSTGTIGIGNGAAGAITVATGAGVGIDSVTASHFTITGAADLTLSSSAGNVVVSGTALINNSVNKNTSINTGTSTGTVSIGNALSGAITVATAAGVGIDAATASHFTVTGALVDLTLSSVGGSVVLDGSEAAADAISISASNAAGGIDVNAGTGGIDLDTTGAISIDGVTASNVTVTGAGADLTVNSVGGSVNIDGSEAAADAVKITSSNAAGGIQVTAGTGSIALSTTGTSGLISVAPATDTQASPSAASTINSRVGSVIFTGFTTANGAAQVWSITNSIVTTGSAIFVSVSNLGANDAQMTVTRVKPAAGSFTVTTLNNGAAALNGNVIVNFWVIN